MNKLLLCVCGTAIALGAASPALGQVRVIYTNIASSPTSDIPGLAGVKFHSGGTNQFDRPYLSPDGTRWIFKAGTDSPVTTANEVIVIGSGATFAAATATVVAQEGSPTPWDGAVNYGVIGTYMGINNTGHFAFTADTTAATTLDQIVAGGTAGSVVLLAREGDAAPGQGAGIGYGSAADAVHMLNDNTVCFRTATLTGATLQQVLYRGSAIVSQTDVTTPTGQLVAPDQTIDALTAARYETDPTGTHVIYSGDLNGPIATDLVMVFDGAVKAQEGLVLPGSGYTSNVSTLSLDAGSQHVGSAGDYIFRGGNVDGIDWVDKNGAVIAQTDAPITSAPGETETYDDTTFSTEFFVSAINAHGDYVIGGTTSNPDSNHNAVLVLNGSRVIAREGDPVDINANGQNDDDTFLSVFNNDDSVLTTGLVYYFFADLRNSAGTLVGQAFMSIDLNTATCPADLASQGGIPGADGHLDNNDFVVFIDYFFNHNPLADRGVQGGIPGSDSAWDNNDFVVFIDQFFTPC